MLESILVGVTLIGVTVSVHAVGSTYWLSFVAGRLSGPSTEFGSCPEEKPRIDLALDNGWCRQRHRTKTMRHRLRRSARFLRPFLPGSPCLA